mgnify:CR=1 FL=1
MRYTAGLLLLAVIAGHVTDAGAQSGDGALLQHRGQHPLNALFGLPAVAARPVRDRRWQVALEHGNSFMGGVRGEEILLLDGESTELVLRHQRQLGTCWQGEIVLPFVLHTPGWADRAIDEWHQFFRLPDAERGTYPDDELLFIWRDAEGRRREIDEPVGGLGDVQLSVQRTLGCRRGRSRAADGAIARLGIKLPSGSADRLLGSGAADLYVDLQSPVRSLARRWRGGATFGALMTGPSELFAEQRPLVLFGAFGLELRLRPRWSAHLQLDWHTPFHDSALRELGELAASLAVGLRYATGKSGRFEVSIAEDALIDTAPDIVVRLAWSWASGRSAPTGIPRPARR